MKMGYVMRRVCLLWVSFLLVLPIESKAQGDQMCFPDVPGVANCIRGRFLEYWYDNGGLYTFGYPITSPAMEVNADTGKSYLTQWFERNRFEYHPENNRPFDVLLGRLGDERLHQIGRVWQAEGRESGPKAGCRWFEKTGHNVCNQDMLGDIPYGFLDVWLFGVFGSARGQPPVDLDYSMRLFGLPLTAEHIETNSSGDTVLTQWFERARMEWHLLGNVDKVLLGLLGNEVHGGTPPIPPPINPPPPAVPAVSILSAHAYQSSNTGYLVGEVRNDVGQNVQFVKLVGTFFNAAGAVIGTDYTYTTLDILRPGQKSPFRLSFDWPLGFYRFEVVPQWRLTQDEPLSGLVLVSHASQVRSGTHHIIGQVRNDTGGPVEYVKIIGTFYNLKDEVAWTEYTYTTLDVIGPGQYSPFDMSVEYWNGSVRYELQLQGRRP